VETTEVRTSLVYQVRVFVCNPQDQLRLGMPATITIPLDQPAAAEPPRSLQADVMAAPPARRHALQRPACARPFAPAAAWCRR